MNESYPGDMLEEKAKAEEEDTNEENMGSVKSKLKKLNSAKPKRKMENFDYIKVSGDEHTYMCGVVEGFYGRPWTAEQRKELFRRLVHTNSLLLHACILCSISCDLLEWRKWD